MAEYTQDLSLFNRLRRLFSNDVVVRNVSTSGGDHQLKVIDINQIQKSGKYQTNSLVDRFSRLYIYNNKNIFSPTLNYQTLRIVLLQDYEAMDTDAIVSSALDVLADECLLKNDRGEILNIISSDENIKRSLENLFYDVLNIDFNLWSWVRGMLKYGDFFLKLEISEKFGIFNVLPYSPYHMTRIEGQDPNNPTKVMFQLDPDGLAAAQDPNYLPKGEGGAVNLENYEVAHFRLLTDSNYLPYGRSYLEPARKIFKQMTLCLPGDAVIWTPEGYKLMENIQKGDSIYSFDYKNNTFVESKVTNKINTGIKPTYKIWTKHRCLEATGNHPVMLADGTYKPVEKLTTDDCIVLGKDLTIQGKGELSNFNLDPERRSLCGINHNLLESPHVLTQQIGLSTSNFSPHKGSHTGYQDNTVNDLCGFGYSENAYHTTYTDSGVPVEKIIKIEKASDGVQVYDISVESEFKNFIANGVVVHNCEDAAMIHRIMRAPEKRIFYINVGQIPPNEVENFMQKTINNMKKTPYVGKDGQYNLRFNMQNMMEDFYIPVRGGDTSTRVETTPGLNYDGMEDIKYYQNKLFSALKIPRAYLGYEENLCVVPETEIPLMNGTTKTVAELIQDHEAGVQNYVYSLDENTGLIVPGKVTWAGYTRKNADLVRVWLDNEQYLDTTPDHLFMTRDGEWIEAQDLKEGTSLMPLYLGSDKRGYTTVYQPFTQTYRPVHRIVAEHYDNNLSGSDRVVHHIDCNKLNNYPENLDCSMNFWQHRAFHAAKVKDMMRQLREQGYYESERFHKNRSELGRRGGLKSAAKLGEWSRTHHPWNYREDFVRLATCKNCSKEFTPTYYSKAAQKDGTEHTQFCCQKCAGEYKHLHPNEYRSPNRDKAYYIDLNEFYTVAATAKNFYEIMEHFNITRNTFNKFLRDHNIDKHELVWDVMLEAQKEPNFIRNFTKRRNHKVVKVEFLTERRDTCDLRVENYHNFATAAGVFIHNSGKATLSAEDIRFARTIERIQRIIESELTKIALVHLYAQGFTGESLTNFDLKLTTPSVIFEQEKVALLKEKVDLARQMQDLDMFPSDYIYENIFGISEEEYQEMRDLVREDAKNSFRLSQIESEGNDPALSGKSYGTPHDLASMYGRRSTPAPKGAAPGDVPAGYAEKPREWGQPGPQGGRPRKRASFYGTQDNPAGGADPTGRMNMHQPYESDAEYVMEGRNVNINFPKAKEEQMQEIKSEVAKVEMLQENRFSKIDSMLAGLGEKLNLKKQQKPESEINELDLSDISMLNDETFVE